MTSDESWPTELDGVIAAPDHHKVLFDNDRVRVIETIVKVGDTTPVHTHPRTVMYVVSGDQFIRRDDTRQSDRRYPRAGQGFQHAACHLV